MDYLEFCPDLDHVFFGPPFGSIREFLFIEDGQEVIVTTKCCWDNESLRSRVIMQQQGGYPGTVTCFVHKNIFKTEPQPEQIIYSPCRPFRIGYRVVGIADMCECYELYLDKLIA